MSKAALVDDNGASPAKRDSVCSDAWLAAIAAVEAETELDGEMPDELWQALQTHTKSEMEGFLRSMVQGIKRNIRNRILAASEKPSEQPGGKTL